MSRQFSTSTVGISSVTNRIGFSYLYLRTYICPSYTYYDPPTDSCINCTVAYCMVCTSSLTCSACTTGYTLNTTSVTCSIAPTCTAGYIINSTSNTCIYSGACFGGGYYIDSSTNTCMLKVCNLGYTLNLTSTVCYYVGCPGGYILDIAIS